ncbi:LytTR family transcriptional regulator DNA-binding domain-containing protein [Cetobacterium sp. SF1]|uniref:LytTR family transcriptional regulator DNA-binding domain-containing protein n=1 Tax=Cetobacterium sp. SF1 TaxID=3417654 RepID=UPI003CEF5F8E
MEHILLDVEKNLKILLKEILKYTFISYEEKNNSEIILIIDDIAEDLRNKIEFYSKKGIKVIVLIGENNAKAMREFMKNEYIFECLLKTEIYLLEKIINKILIRKTSNSTDIKNIFCINILRGKMFLNINEVTHITYSSINRKTEFHAIDKKPWATKKNLSDVESQIKNLNNFYKLDRGTIINLNLIKLIDYNDEKLVFINDNFVYTGKSKLKELEENLNFQNYIIC